MPTKLHILYIALSLYKSLLTSSRTNQIYSSAYPLPYINLFLVLLYNYKRFKLPASTIQDNINAFLVVENCETDREFDSHAERKQIAIGS